MRIVSGEFRGRVLTEFSGSDIRPTGDKVRESLFNILQSRIIGSTFLDLFCGTGAVGIEALSRGAKEVVVNDSAKASIGVVKKNVEKLKIADRIIISNLDALTYLKQGKKFDVIFIDPPYKSGLGYTAVNCAKSCLTDKGIIILEDEKKFNGQIDNELEIYDERKYGRVYLTFIRKVEKSEE